jgi:hypothetical protein
MSAHLCSHNDIRALVTFAFDQCNAMDLIGLDPNELGALLWAENARSLRTRYQERAAAYFPLSPIVGQLYDHRRVLLDRFSLLKQLDHYDYQSCESSDYQTRPAAKAVAIMRHCVLSDLGLTQAQAEAARAYKDAPWGLDDDDDETATAPGAWRVAQ